MAPLILIPGLGADARLLAPQAAAFPGLVVPPWLDPKKNESLTAYASRLAATLPITGETVLGGVSFGGMLALEIAMVTRPRGVILIASCRHPRAISPMVHRFATVGLKFPLPNALSRLAPLAMPALGPMGPAERAIALAMAETVPMSFMRWGARAIFDWQGCENAAFPVFHVHGGADRIIPARSVKADHVVLRAGHLLNLTHAKELNKLLASRIAQF